MQVINQNQHLIDNIPAHKYGEWPGIKSSKWNGSIKIIKPIDQDIFKDNSLLPLAGRRHFSAKHSDEMKFRPAKKLFTEIKNLEGIEEKKLGLKSVKPIFSETKINWPKRHFAPKYGTEADPEPFQIRTFFPNGNCRTLKELTLEKNVGSKKRIPSLDVMRNGLLSGAPGDKIYKNPEYSKDFYKEGGIVAGSSSFNNLHLQKTTSKRADNFYQTLDLTKKTLDPNKIWTNKVKKEEFEADYNYVKTLTNWDNTVLKEHMPNTEKGGKGQAILSNRTQKGDANKKVAINKANQKSSNSKK